MPDDEIKEHSAEFLFGQILAEIRTLKQGAAELTAAVKDLPETNSTCQQRFSRLVSIEERQTTCLAERKSDASFKRQAGLKLWHAVIIVLATVAAEKIGTLVVEAAAK